MYRNTYQVTKEKKDQNLQSWVCLSIRLPFDLSNNTFGTRHSDLLVGRPRVVETLIIVSKILIFTCLEQKFEEKRWITDTETCSMSRHDLESKEHIIYLYYHDNSSYLLYEIFVGSRDKVSRLSRTLHHIKVSLDFNRK